MELSQLRYFQAVARFENMSKAAEALFVSQPSLSISISRLEEELGVPLFERRRGKLRLNHNGELFLGYVNQSLALLNDGVQALRSEHVWKNDTIFIATMVSDSTILKRFLLEHPTIRIRHQTLELPAITEGLLKREIDLALTVLPPPHEQIVFEQIFKCDYVIVLSKNHPLVARDAISFSELRKERFVFDDSRTNIAIAVDEFRKHGITPIIDHDVRYLDMLFALVEANRCISILPRINYQEVILAGQHQDVECRPFAETAPQAFWGIARNKSVPLSPDGEAFRQFVNEYFQEISDAFWARNKGN